MLLRLNETVTLWGLLLSQALAIPVNTVLTDQLFEWRSEFAYRIDGTYGEHDVVLEAGRQCEIFTSDAAGGTTADAYLYLLNVSFVKVAEDDDSGGNLQARIVFTLSAPGTYHIRLGMAAGPGAGVP